MKIKKKVIGQFFTPKYIAKFMVKNIVDYFREFKSQKYDVKILEPAVGKGIFLKYLKKYNFSDITAYEIDKKLKNELQKNFPEVKLYFNNFLGSKINEKFDLIIGNPPYLGSNPSNNSKIFQDYVEKYPVCEKFFVGNMDLFYYFIHLGILKLNPGGILSFITTNYWITKSKKTGIKVLKPHVLNECYILQYIDLSSLKLFKNATGQHNCIFLLKKKTAYEKTHRVNKSIEIIQVGKKKDLNQSDEDFNKRIFTGLIENKESKYINKYKSALTNNDLKEDSSWNLLYPEKVKILVDKIEIYCSNKRNITLLKDYFVIRNGLIFIKDNIFILKDGKNLKVENNNFFVKVNKIFIKLSDVEKRRLKKIYKSKSIKPYSYFQNEFIGYAIFFNKSEFNSQRIDKRNYLYDEKYPVLTAYLKQFEKDLREILINAKENPNDFYFPRRGTFIRKFEDRKEEKLVDLEPLYSHGKKVFLKYISDKNIFGYSDESYFATSDTYFLWPKYSENDIDYLFMIAYLNSKIVNFLFKAKNISIKRSKTKLEDGLPILDLNKFKSKKKASIISLIKLLSYWLIELNRSNQSIKVKDKLSNLSYFSITKQDELIQKIIAALENRECHFIRRVIDKLFFQLLDLKEKEIDYLIEKYYQF